MSDWDKISTTVGSGWDQVSQPVPAKESLEPKEPALPSLSEDDIGKMLDLSSQEQIPFREMLREPNYRFMDPSEPPEYTPELDAPPDISSFPSLDMEPPDPAVIERNQEKVDWLVENLGDNGKEIISGVDDATLGEIAETILYAPNRFDDDLIKFVNHEQRVRRAMVTLRKMDKTPRNIARAIGGFSDLFGVNSFLDRNGWHPITDGAYDVQLEAINRIIAEEPLDIGNIAAKFGGDAPRAILEFAMIPNVAGKIKWLKAAPKWVQRAIRAGAKFGARELVQAPRRDETFGARLKSVGASTGVGMGVGALGGLPAAGRVPLTVGGFAGLTYLQTGDREAALETAIHVFGFQALGLAQKAGRFINPRIKRLYYRKAVKAARQRNPDLHNLSDLEVANILRAQAQNAIDMSRDHRNSHKNARAMAKRAWELKQQGDPWAWREMQLRGKFDERERPSSPPTKGPVAALPGNVDAGYPKQGSTAIEVFKPTAIEVFKPTDNAEVLRFMTQAEQRNAFNAYAKAGNSKHATLEEFVQANKNSVFNAQTGGLIEKQEQSVVSGPLREMMPVYGKHGGFVDYSGLANAKTQGEEFMRKATKHIERFTGLDSGTRQVLIEMEEQLRVLADVSAKISEEVGLLQLTDKEDRLVSDYIEQRVKNPEKFPDPLPPKLYAVAQKIEAGQNEAFARLQGIGVLNTRWPDGQVQYLEEKLKELRDEDAPQEEIEATEQSLEDIKDLRYLHHAYKDKRPGLVGRWFSGKKITDKPRGLIGRKYPTYEDAENAGHERAPLAVSYADMWHSTLKAVEMHRMITAINENPNLALPEQEAPDDWVSIPEQVFPSSVKTGVEQLPGGEYRAKKTMMKYPVPIAEALKEITYQDDPSPLTRAYDKINLALKLVSFYNPVYMGKSDAEQMWRVAGVKGAKKLPNAVKILAEGRKHREGDLDITPEAKTYHMLRRYGLFNNVISYEPAARDVTQKMLDEIRMTWGDRAAREASEWLNPANWLQKTLDTMRGFSEATTWNVDQVMRIATYESIKNSKMLKGLTDFEKVEFVNDAMVNYGKLPRKTKAVLQRAIFTPVYRIGNFRFWLDDLARQPWRYKGPILRTMAYKFFIKYGLPAAVGTIIAMTTGKEKEVYTEKGYRLVIHDPETNTDSVYSLSGPLLEGAKVTQRTFRQSLRNNLAVLPNFLFRALDGPQRRVSDDPLGEFFRLGTPVYRDILVMGDEDKSTAEKLLTTLAIAFTYKRKGREQDKEPMLESVAKTLSIWTDWKEQAADIENMFTGKSYYNGPGGEIGRLLREYRSESGIEEDKVDREIDKALMRGDEKEAVRIALENERYQTVDGLSGRFLRHYKPITYFITTMPDADKIQFIGWLRDNKKIPEDDIEELLNKIDEFISDEDGR